MKAVLRVDASAAIGNGHLARSLTLARGLLGHGFSVAVATQGPSAHARSWIEREGHVVIPLDVAPGSPADVAATRAACEHAALVVVDGYVFDAGFHGALRGAKRVVAVIDDLAEARLGGDAVLNGNLYAEELAYDARPSTLMLVGPRYALVREEFVAARTARQLAPREPGQRPRLLVTMGGADPTAETEKALAALGALAPMDVRVVVGGANPRAAEIREAAGREGRHSVEVLVDVRDMGEQMVWCDVALTAAGSTCLELACVGVAAACVIVADNQRLVGDAFGKRGLMANLGRHEAVDAGAIAKAVAALLEDPARRRAMEAAQRAAVDGGGKDRAAASLAAACRTAGA